MSNDACIFFHQVSIHDPLTPADLRSEGVEIEPGYVSTILITPRQEIMQDKGSQPI